MCTLYAEAGKNRLTFNAFRGMGTLAVFGDQGNSPVINIALPPKGVQFFIDYAPKLLTVGPGTRFPCKISKRKPNADGGKPEIIETFLHLGKTEQNLPYVEITSNGRSEKFPIRPSKQVEIPGHADDMEAQMAMELRAFVRYITQQWTIEIANSRSSGNSGNAGSGGNSNNYRKNYNNNRNYNNRNNNYGSNNQYQNNGNNSSGEENADGIY
jgi:hypothetical protein